MTPIQTPITSFFNPPDRPNSSSDLPNPNSISDLSLVSYNVTSLSDYSNNSNHSLHRSISDISSFKIICLQETKLRAGEASSLRSLLPNHTIFYDNNPLNSPKTPLPEFKAGVLTAFHSSLLRDYTIHRIPAHNDLDGHVALFFLSCNSNSKPSLVVVNLRFLTLPDHSATLRSQEHFCSLITSSLSLFLRAQPALRPIIFLSGDFNFVTNPSDTTSTKSLPSRPSWDSLLETFNLSDLQQDTHTFLFHSDDPNVLPRSSRLDRIYSNFSEADRTILTPTAFIAGNPLLGKKKFNSHVPVGLKLLPISAPSLSFKLPLSTLHNPSFVAHFSLLWSSRLKSADPLAELATFKRLLSQTHHNIKHTNANNLISTYVASVRLYRILSSPHPDPEAFDPIFSKHPFLCKLAWNDAAGWNLSLLRSFINSLLLSKGEVDPSSLRPANTTEANFHSLPSSPDSSKPSAHYLTKLKLILPSSRSTIVALKSDPASPPTQNPSVLGPLIENYFSPIWNCDTTDNAPLIDDYISDYPDQ